MLFRSGSNRHSFPSGHTATAFMTATMLNKEYGHKSPWIGVGAYGMATATGLMRMANNKHWLNTYKTKDKQGSQWIHTVHPICLRGADYLSKDLNTNIGDGRNFTLIGLKQAPQRRLELFKQGQALGKPTNDKQKAKS